MMQKKKKIPRDTTIADGIREVLRNANKPLTGREIYEELPLYRLVKPLNLFVFWKHFSPMVKRSKREKIERVDCERLVDGLVHKCGCYRIKKKED